MVVLGLYIPSTTILFKNFLIYILKKSYQLYVYIEKMR